mmetsp:Transcript_3227/g.8937  ORF Transcript_3227/g.8937 Transcript_3227/m.8937 type:complete len:141 (-) Transcript_3227:2206-2628(-)
MVEFLGDAHCAAVGGGVAATGASRIRSSMSGRDHAECMSVVVELALCTLPPLECEPLGFGAAGVALHVRGLFGERNARGGECMNSRVGELTGVLWHDLATAAPSLVAPIKSCFGLGDPGRELCDIALPPHPFVAPLSTSA